MKRCSRTIPSWRCYTWWSVHEARS